MKKFGDDGNIQIEAINEEMSPGSQDITPIISTNGFQQETNFQEEEKLSLKLMETVQVEINFGDIQELEKIAQGSFGIVTKAIHLPSNILMALKVIFIRKFQLIQMKRIRSK